MAKNYTPIATGAAANAATFNAVFDQFDIRLGDVNNLGTVADDVTAAINEVRNYALEPGGAGVRDSTLIRWTEAEAYQLTSITYDSATGVASSATVRWPDGSAGTFTAVTINATYEAVDAYTITHSASGKMVSQPAVSRDSFGRVTVKPILTVA